METRVLTPFGFKLLGDVRVGDQVCNPDGTVARVVAVHDRGVQEFYRVTLSDGASVEASADHLWAVSFAGARRRRKEPVPLVPAGLRAEDEWNLRLMQRTTIVTTRELAALVDREAGKGTRGVRTNAPQVPLSAPLALTAAPGRWPLMPPYTLGALLGDGHLGARGISITATDAGIVERMRAELGEGLRVVPMAAQGHAPCYRIAGAVGQKAESPQALLRREGLLGLHAHEKFIPERIKLGPPDVRFAFAQGLFDTDGSMDERGHVDYVTTSQQLAADVQWLVRSLGFKATLSGKQPHFRHHGERRAGRPAYRLYVRGPHQERLFSLPRKVERATVFNGGDVWPAHRVVSVEPTDNDNARCITVDHPNGLYVTDDFIVTHNSSALLTASLQYVDVPGYAALILRQSYPDLSLPGAIMDRAHEWLRPTDARWNETEKTWTFPSGATLSFGYIQHEADKYRYAGSELQFIAFDELTAFTESQYRFLFSRLRRRAAVDVPLRMRAASNPGGAGHDWVKQRFLVEGRSHGRIYIPARLDDNPHLDAVAYRASLANLDPTTRAQLVAGNWDVRQPGRLFRRTWFAVVDAAPVGMQTLRYWDLAATEPKAGCDPDYTAGLLLGSTDDNVYYVLDVRRTRATPREVESLVRQTADLDGPGVPIRMEQEPGSSGVQTIDYYTRRVLSGFDFRGVRSTGPKEVRAQPVSSQAEAGNVRLVRAPWVGPFLDELEAFPTTGVHDDQVDALSGAMAELADSGPAGVWVA